jgi:hypothetical protein
LPLQQILAVATTGCRQLFLGSALMRSLKLFVRTGCLTFEDRSDLVSDLDPNPFLNQDPVLDPDPYLGPDPTQLYITS